MSCNHSTCHEDSCIQHVPIFEGLSEQEKCQLHHVIQSRPYQKREVIFQEGDISDTLYIIHTGIVKISKYTETGKEQIIRFLFPGDFFGQFSLLLDKTHYANAEVLEHAQICSIYKKDFLHVIEHNPNMAYRFLIAVSERLQQTDDWVGTISLMEVERRLAKTLLLFNRNQHENSDTLKLPIAKKELAALIGTTPETLSRKLTSLEAQGILSLVQTKQIKILNFRALEELA